MPLITQNVKDEHLMFLSLTKYTDSPFLSSLCFSRVLNGKP